MALTQTNLGYNVAGNRREDYIQITFGAVTSGIVTTRLHWIEALSCEDVSGGDSTFDVWPNSDTASATEDDPGHIFFANVTAGQIYNVRCIGW